MHKYALVVIDMQRGFLDPSSPLYIAGAADTVPACAQAIDCCHRAGVLSDCTSSVTPAVQQANLADMQRVGGRIMTAADLEQLLG